MWWSRSASVPVRSHSPCLGPCLVIIVSKLIPCKPTPDVEAGMTLQNLEGASANTSVDHPYIHLPLRNHFQGMLGTCSWKCLLTWSRSWPIIRPDSASAIPSTSAVISRDRCDADCSRNTICRRERDAVRHVSRDFGAHAEDRRRDKGYRCSRGRQSLSWRKSSADASASSAAIS